MTEEKKDQNQPKDDNKPEDNLEGNQQDDTNNGGKDDSKPKADIKMSQEEFDALIEKRLKRQKDSLLEEWENEKKKAEMSEAEKAKAEKEEADKKANNYFEELRNTRLEMVAERQATTLGARPERIEKVIKLADFSEVEFDDNGKPDSEQIKTAINTVLEDIPELKAPNGNVGGGGSNPADDSSIGALTREKIKKMSTDEINQNWDRIQKFLATNR